MPIDDAEALREERDDARLVVLEALEQLEQDPPDVRAAIETLRAARRSWDEPLAG